MYNQYTLACSTASFPEFHPSHFGSSCITDINKPSFLIQDTGSRKVSSTLKEKVEGQSKGGKLSTQLTTKLQMIDSNPFLRARQVHFKPVYAPKFQDKYVPLMFHQDLPPQTDYYSTIEQILPTLYEANVKKQRPQPKIIPTPSQQEINPERKEVRIQQILSEISKPTLQHHRKPSNFEYRDNLVQFMVPEENQKSNQYTRDMQVNNRREEEQEEYPPYPRTLQLQDFKDLNSPTPKHQGTESYSFINRLVQDHNEPQWEGKVGQTPFVSSQVEQFRKEQLDPTAFWKKYSNELQGPRQPPRSTEYPRTIYIQGIPYHMISV